MQMHTHTYIYTLIQRGKCIHYALCLSVLGSLDELITCCAVLTRLLKTSLFTGDNTQ